jgi:DNA repair exonuclease SbcCD ATPase subunit
MNQQEFNFQKVERLRREIEEVQISLMVELQKCEKLLDDYEKMCENITKEFNWRREKLNKVSDDLNSAKSILKRITYLRSDN